MLSASACTSSLDRWGEVTPYPTLTPIPSPTLRISASPTLAPTPTPTTSPTPDPSPTATSPPSSTPLACWSEGGKLEKRAINSPQLEDPLEYQVFTPPCYEHFADKHYPVLYLLHGLYYSDNQWLRMGAHTTANTLMAEGEIPPFIIIFPRDHIWTLPPENKFGEVLVRDLVPWIDSHYRTIPGNEYRAIGGLSRGGNWAIHIVLQYWDIFGALGAHSAPIFYSDGLRLSDWLDEIPSEEMPRIFLDIGQDDKDNNYILSFEEMLRERGIPHEWHLNSGSHNEEYWISHLDQYLLWYSEAWREE